MIYASGGIEIARKGLQMLWTMSHVTRAIVFLICIFISLVENQSIVVYRPWWAVIHPFFLDFIKTRPQEFNQPAMKHHIHAKR